MPVDFQHENYQKFLPLWRKMRDAVGGEQAIKEKTTQYLPIPPGIHGRGSDSPEYKNYLTRARYPDKVGPAVEGMVGLMSRKPTQIEIPKSMEYLHEEASVDGLTLEGLLDRIKHEVVTLGRYVLIVDINEEVSNDPYIATCSAESVINWDVDENGNLSMIVVYEIVYEKEPDDRFSKKPVEQWRVYELEKGIYTINIYRKGKKDFILQESIIPRIKGDPLNYLPVVIIGSRDLLPAPDDIPLFGVATKSLHYYRQYADYALQLFMCANGTTPFFGGDVPKDDLPDEVGPGVTWAFTTSNIKAGYIEISGTGLNAQKQELDKIEQEINMDTVRALSDKRAQEAAETLRMRFQSQTATLISIAKSVTSGLELALSYCAEWIGADPEQIEVRPNLDLIREQPDPQLMNALYSGIERGLTPMEVLADYMHRVELTDLEPEEYANLTVAGQTRGVESAVEDDA